MEGIVSTDFTEALLQSPESERLEFKAADAELERIAASVCAFLNTEGGTMIFGVRPDGQIEPISKAETKARQIEQFLHAALSPPALWSVSVDATSRGDVVTIEVPSGKDRPYVCNGSIFVRRGAQTLPADAETIRRLVHQHYTEPTRWERLPAAGLEMTELQEAEVLRTASEAQRKRNYAFRHPDDPAAVLSDLGLMQTGQLTNGADVLFAANPSRRLPQTRIRATAYITDKGGDFADNRLFEGNAFFLLDQAFGFVEQHVRIAAEFRTGKVERVDRPEYPFAALREGLVNAIVHRDYSAFSGGMSVDIYPNRIEFWNTGRLPAGMKISDLKKDHRSIAINPDMAHAFYLRGVIERIGRGTLKIVDECKAVGLRAPSWRLSRTGITLVFFGRQHKPPLNSRQRALLERLRPGDAVRPSDYYGEMQSVVSQRQAQRDLSGLESGGWLRQQGDGPATFYVRSDRDVP
jgi:ATP-dependent DNA helicase RecG